MKNLETLLTHPRVSRIRLERVNGGSSLFGVTVDFNQPITAPDGKVWNLIATSKGIKGEVTHDHLEEMAVALVQRMKDYGIEV